MSFIDEQKSSNPILKGELFKQTVEPGSETMTLEGTFNKVGISFALLFFSACYGWLESSFSLVLIGGLGGLAIALLTFSQKQWAPFTVPLYSIFQGLFLGSFSHALEKLFPGIISLTILITILILGVTLAAYRFGLLKVTERLRKMVIIGTATIVLMYLLHFILSIAGGGLPMVHSSTLIGIVLSLIIVGVASLHLVLDFDYIETAIKNGSPKAMEWYGAFSLLVTIVWLYVEVVRLINKWRKHKFGSNSSSDPK